MKIKLKDITRIRSGIFCKPSPFGNIRYLQSTDYTGGLLNPVNSLTPMITADDKTDKHILAPGEILFSAKGTNNYSALYTHPGYHSIASSSFLVLSLEPQTPVLPEYLCWYLNHPETLRLLEAGSKGTSIRSISKSEIMELEVAVPSVEKQKIMVEFGELLKQEYRLQTQLNLLKKQLLIKSINQ